MDYTYLLYYYSTIAQSFAALIALTLIFWTHFHEQEHKYLLFVAFPLPSRLGKFQHNYSSILYPNYPSFLEDIKRFERAISERNGEMMLFYFSKINDVITKFPPSFNDPANEDLFNSYLLDYQNRATPIHQHVYLIRIVKDVLIRLSIVCIFLITCSLILILLQKSNINPHLICFLNILLLCLAIIALFYFFYLLLLILSDNPDLKINKILAQFWLIKRQ